MPKKYDDYFEPRNSIRKLKNVLNPKLSPEQPFHTIVWFDMDTLKMINEKYNQVPGGHNYLLAFSKALANAAPKGEGFAAHIYGDEFLLYLPWAPTVTYDFLTSTFEEARVKELKKWRFYNKAITDRVPLNYSAGIVEISPRSSIEKAIDLANRKCKIAKISIGFR